MRDHDTIRSEIERLKRDGLIRPTDVVEAAQDENSPLHDCFTWDDGEAAHQYRLIEARNLIRVYVQVLPKDDTKTVPVFVSLTTDRTKPGGGYRALADVMSSEQLYQQMLSDALVHLRNVQQKYRSIRELESVWNEVEKIERASSPRSNTRSTHVVAANG